MGYLLDLYGMQGTTTEVAAVIFATSGFQVMVLLAVNDLVSQFVKS
jgi:hypothetical protein